MPDAKFESGSLSIFGDMTSQNFPMKKGMAHRIRVFTPWKMGLALKNEFFMSRIVFLYPELTPMSISAVLKQRKIFSFSKFLRRLNEKRAAATPLIDQFC